MKKHIITAAMYSVLSAMIFGNASSMQMPESGSFISYFLPRLMRGVMFFIAAMMACIVNSELNELVNFKPQEEK